MTKEGMNPKSGVKPQVFIANLWRRFLFPLKVKQQPDERGYHVLTLLTPYMRGGQLERLQLEGCDTWCMEMWCVLQRSSIRFVLVLRCYLNLDHLLACSQHLNMPTLQQLGKILLLWSMARLNLILSRAIILIALRIIFIESNLGMEMCVGRFCSYWSVSATEISCETPNCKRGLYWDSRSGWCRDAAGLAKNKQISMLPDLPPEHSQLDSPWTCWQEALECMESLGFSAEERRSVFQLVAAVPGNLKHHVCSHGNVARGVDAGSWYHQLTGAVAGWHVLPGFWELKHGLTNRTGKCVKMVYGLWMWGTFCVFQMCALPIECFFGAGGKWWQSDRRWRTCWQDLRTLTGLKSWLHQDVSALWLGWCNVNGRNHPWLLFKVFIGGVVNFW